MNKEPKVYQSSDESVVVYHSEDNMLELDVRLADETVWLTQQQMVVLFTTLNHMKQP